MIITLKYFGFVAETLNKSGEEMQIAAPLRVADLRKMKEAETPALAKSDYRVAVNQVLVNESFEINAPAEIAFLPPFAGG
jgi:sulfur-carrier protein